MNSVYDYGEGRLVNIFEIEESSKTVDVMRLDVETMPDYRKRVHRVVGSN